MLKRIFIKFLLISAFYSATGLQPKAAQKNNFGIKNFSKSNYQAASQNWAVSAGNDGMMYFANNNGLLEFDGTSWQLHKLPNETILRAVFVENDSIIYSSGYREIGFWKRGSSGKLVYTSLNPLAKELIERNDEFWNIASLNGEIFFHFFTKILGYKNDTIISIKLPGFINTMHKVRNEVLVASRNLGIYKIEDDQVKPFILDPFFKDKTIRFLLPYKQNQLMIGTASDGIVIWDGKQLREWKPEWTSYFKENELNRAIITEAGDLIIGSLIDGIVIFDKNEQFKYKLNVSNGLQNNTILGIETDQFNNIWLSLDSGIDFISSSPLKGIQIENIPDVGTVYSAAIFQSKIYLGTNQGLFVKGIDNPNNTFKLIPESQGQVWDMKVIDDNLFVGQNEGTLVVSNNQAEFISRNSGGFAIKQDTENPDYLIQSTYSSMVVFKKENNHYQFSHLIQGFYDLIRYIEIDHLGNIWASHMHRGIYKLQLDDKREKVISEKYFGEKSVFKKDHSVHVFKIENRIVFTTEEQLYTYDDLNDTIIPFNALNEKLGKYAQAHRIIEAPGHNYWFITNDNLALFKINADRVELIRSYPSTIFKNNPLIDEYENIQPVSETKAIVCLENGIAWLDASVNESQMTINYYSPQLREFQLINKRNEHIDRLPRNKYIKIDFAHNNIQLRYSFPHYTDEPIFYQSYMQGISSEWSEKSENPSFRFDRLPAGTYELQVKASDLWNNESQINLLTIEVLSPWYLTGLAKFVYLVLAVLILLGFRAWGIRQTKRKEQEEHDKREKELIRLRNEKLNAEVSHKSKELANSTMAIIKKNEFLLDLKQIVFEQKEQLGSRYPDKYYLHLTNKIEKNISSQDDWQIFETNFEQAHEQFLKKIKDDFPALTVKDLRLAAYLRMNLSSKEIAPLLGISVRGVENHRYRLRKKVGLEHDDNLIDLILKY